MAEALREDFARQAARLAGQKIRLGERHVTPGMVLEDKTGQVYVATKSPGAGVNAGNHLGIDGVDVRVINTHGDEPVLTYETQLPPGSHVIVAGFWALDV